MNEKVSVVTYDNPYTFYKIKEIRNYQNSMHVCATTSLKDGLGKLTVFSNLITMREVIRKFYEGWNDIDVRFHQYAVLSDILRSYQGANPEVLRSFKRNKLNLLITMRNLSEIFLTPESIFPYCQTEEEKLFCRIWNEMQSIFEPYLKVANNKLQSEDLTKQILLQSGFGQSNSSVVLHGFYFITPVQHYVFSKWKEHGIHLVFLNMYDGDKPSLFGFLEENFSAANGWIDRESWTVTNDKDALAAKQIAKVLEGGNYEPLQLKMEEIPYNYVIDFIQNIKKETIYISPNEEELNTRLRDFYPEAYVNERHFLSYPIGQYLLHLHSIWKEETEEYVITERIMRECFASGWLQSEQGNAKDSTHQLDKILPYFSDCRTDKEWFERINKLMLSKKAVSKTLKNFRITKADHFKAVRVSPGLRFSFFSVPMKDLKRIRSHFKRLILNARELFDIKEKRVTIKQHFNKIQDLLDEAHLYRESLSHEESILINQLKEALAYPIENQSNFHISDLADAIIMFLKKGLEKNDLDLDDENPVPHDLKIKRFEVLDGFIYGKDFPDVHLCGMDERHFPVTSAPMPWPITKELLSRLDYPATNMYLFREKHRLSFSKYLFYLLLNYKGKITFSWIRNFNDEENLDKSIYIELLGLNPLPDNTEIKYEYEPASISEENIEEAMLKLEALPREEYVEMQLCPRRFYYSTVSDYFSSYSSLFHMQFLIGNLVKIYGAVGRGKEEIVDLLHNLFPFLSNIRLRTIVDSNMNENLLQSTLRFGLQKHLKFDEIEYPVSSMYFHFLTHRGAFESEQWKSSFDLMSQGRLKRREVLSRVLNGKLPLLEATPSVFCKLCPHSSYCEDAYYPVDLKGKGFDDRDETRTGTAL
ncbi:hypothetical protein ABEX30_08080 [Priestia aryabhattai]|uniref:hypothetical protein n=1 Tax=Priestia aryabhattai TaxID=412384 RepID=UPI003D2C865C